ncbi:3-hydroxyisobutyryl-CoA hydrolase, mitochondrial-like isoform X2 [Dysidea avara]
MATQKSDLVITERQGKVGTICLNKPKALNALNGEMIQAMYSIVKEWDDDDDVQLIIVKGAGEKAFCAGGDVRAITEAGKIGDPLTINFFKEEYTLNFTTGTLRTPYVCLLDGITMGGGVGISVHGLFRVTTEKTVFAMPETAIGFFPDVGGSYFLPRLQGSLGMFLALTGCRLKSRDVYHAGIGTHFITSDKLPELSSSLMRLSTYNLDAVKDVIDTYHRESLGSHDSPFALQDHLPIINECFSKGSVEEIVSSLETHDSEWAKQQAKILAKMSPTSMKVTHRQLLEGARLSFADCFQMEYRMSQGFVAGKDFYEGVRAVLVDRDNSPKWDPPTLQQVTDKDMDEYFKPLGDNDLQLSGLLYSAKL